ncbi:MAG: Holliday junction branch migration protein RuvA [Phycisphaerales bacterium]|nr:Holliday junction branch migration protein RuvA [Phycisphaerales bacterium]
MITRIRGQLVEVNDGRALLSVGAITYELLVPAADVPDLHSRIGSDAEFHTLHFLEGQAQGASFSPRLIGFCSEQDRAFFVLFTSVKGIGNRKALRALVRPFAELAAAIAQRDAASLTQLPEIGRRTAETIVAELNGKVEEFMGPAGSGEEVAASPFVQDAVAMLRQMGESPRDARVLVQTVLEQQDGIESADQLVQACFRVKEAV